MLPLVLLSPLQLRAKIKGCRMGRSDKVSLSNWYVALLIDTRFRFFFLF